MSGSIISKDDINNIKKIKVDYILTDEDIDRFNKLALDKNIMIVLVNTKGQSSNIIRMANKNIIFSVLGGLDSKKKKFDIYRYQKKTYYNGRDLANIIESLETIERHINPLWSDMEKAMYVYQILVLYLSCDRESTQRNLMDILSSKSVCLGCTMIFKEEMDRLGIKCYLQTKTSCHAWNILKIDDKYYGLDLTWDICGKKNNKCNFYFFGRQDSKKFYHDSIWHSIKKEKEEKEYELSIISNDKIQELYNNINNFRVENINNVNNGMILVKGVIIGIKDKEINYSSLNNSFYIRKDKSKFVVIPTGIKKDNVYEYIYCEYDEINDILRCYRIFSENKLLSNDEKFRDVIANDLLMKKRVKNKIENYNGYVGFIDEKSYIRYYTEEFEEETLNKYRKKVYIRRKYD